MEIRISTYNFPFSHPHQEGVHFISLDDYSRMKLGLYTAHVDSYNHHRVSTFEAFDFLTCVTHVFESSKIPFEQLNSHAVVEAVISSEEKKFLDDLYFDFGIKAAGKRSSRTYNKFNK